MMTMMMMMMMTMMMQTNDQKKQSTPNAISNPLQSKKKNKPDYSNMMDDDDDISSIHQSEHQQQQQIQPPSQLSHAQKTTCSSLSPSFQRIRLHTRKSKTKKMQRTGRREEGITKAITAMRTGVAVVAPVEWMKRFLCIHL